MSLSGTSARLWIDGVGGYLVRFGDELAIGGPGGDGDADLVLLANLSRRHAVVRRLGEGYVFEPLARCDLDGRAVDETRPLRDGAEIALRGGVRLRFRQPSVLSTTARLDFLSRHRPEWSIDGVLLVQETLLLGPGDQNHIVCRDWNESVILSLRNGVLHCRSRTPVAVGGRLVEGEGVLNPGDVVSGEGLRFRLEPVELVSNSGERS